MESEYFDTSVSFKDFEISSDIIEVLDKLNYKCPTKIQKESLPYSLKGKDMIALAETGSGKTLAFALPIIEALLKNPRPYFSLILAPTRELCLQIQEHFNAVGSSFHLKTLAIVGGLDLMAQSVALVTQKPHVIIATPGRILHHLENTKGFSLNKLAYFVMDEADKLLNLNFEEALDKILEQLPKTRTTFLFSATMTNKVNKLQRASLQNPVKVEVTGQKNQTVLTLQQNYIFIPQKYKENYLIYLANEFVNKSTIIFVIKCKDSMKICLLLRNLGFDAIPLHGQMSQVKRIAALNKFKTNEKNLLVATDVAARGLDIPNVDLVINYDVPTNPKDYVHRVGRTARAGKAGLALTIVTQYDVEAYQKIEHAINKKLDEYPIQEKNALVQYTRVMEASRIADFELKKILEKGNKKSMNDNEDGENGKLTKKIKKKQNKKVYYDIN